MSKRSLLQHPAPQICLAAQDKSVPKLQKPLQGAEISRLFPHRYPFLLVDSIVEWEPRRRCVGLKNVSSGERFFQGYVPCDPVMPQTLIVEAMAQVAGMMAMESFDTPCGFYYFAMLENVRFDRQVRPGDELVTEATLQSMRKICFKVHALARVGDEIVAEGDFMFVTSDPSASSLILHDTIHRDTIHQR